MYCQNCGSKLTENDKYCPKCGNFTGTINQSTMDNIPKKRQNDTTILILGIISLLTFWFPIISIPCSIISIIQSNNYKKVNKTKTSSTTISIISLILSIIFIIMTISFINIIVNIEKNTPTTSDYNNKYFYDDDYDNNYNHTNDLDISKHKWYTDDNQILDLTTNNAYSWYIDSNNFQNGTYEVYEKEEAVDYIDKNLTEYGITKEEQWNMFDKENRLNNYYLLILNCNRITTNGETKSVQEQIPYYGFYHEDSSTLSLINMKDNSKINLRLKINKNSSDKSINGSTL